MRGGMVAQPAASMSTLVEPTMVCASPATQLTMPSTPRIPAATDCASVAFTARVSNPCADERDGSRTPRIGTDDPDSASPATTALPMNPLAPSTNTDCVIWPSIPLISTRVLNCTVQVGSLGGFAGACDDRDRLRSPNPDRASGGVAELCDYGGRLIISDESD